MPAAEWGGGIDGRAAANSGGGKHRCVFVWEAVRIACCGDAVTIATRSQSPSVGSQASPWQSNLLSPTCVCFLGVRNLLTLDRFNEYILGWSAKVSPLSLLEILVV